MIKLTHNLMKTNLVQFFYRFLITFLKGFMNCLKRYDISYTVKEQNG